MKEGKILRKKIALRSMLSAMVAMSIFASANTLVFAETKYVNDYKYTPPSEGERKFGNIPESLEGKTAIISTNDVHGAVDKYPYVAALKNNIKNRGASDVILVDCGDFSQDKDDAGYEVMTNSDGKAAIKIMNAIGYDYATIGNHEFEPGVNIESNLKDANFTVIDANIVEANDIKNLSENKGIDELANKFKEVDTRFENDHVVYGDDSSPVKIGFFGLTTHEAKNKVGSKYTIPKDNLMYACAKNQINELKEEDVDLIVCLSHLGLEDNVEYNRSIDVYNKLFTETPGKRGHNSKNDYDIDLVLDGHSHTTINGGNDGAPILSTGMLLDNIGVTIIDNNTKKIEKRLLISQKEFMDNLEPDEETKEVVKEMIKKYDPDNLDKYDKEDDIEADKEDENPGHGSNHHNHGRGGNFKYGFGG